MKQHNYSRVILTIIDINIILIIIIIILFSISMTTRHLLSIREGSRYQIG